MFYKTYIINTLRMLSFLIIGFLSLSGGNVGKLIAKSGEVFGARADDRGPIGGGTGYKNLVTKCNYLVMSREDLVIALKKAKSGEVVYIGDDAELNLTSLHDIIIPGGVTLASGRGRDGSSGALIYTNETKTYSLFRTGGESVRITGLRVRGPELNRQAELLEKLYRTDRKAYNSYPRSRGILLIHPQIEVDNCEIYGWSASAVGIRAGASKAHIHHNYIHHNQLYGLGYGVAVSKADALIEYNLFDWCRHCITSPGYEGSSYEAHDNIVLENSSDSSFDVHGGKDRKDGTDVAGTSFSIHHNTFKATRYAAVGIRGRPVKEARIYNNHFFHKDRDDAVHQRNALGNMKVFRNLFGLDERLIE